MPYGFVGLAVGRADVARSATVSYIKTITPAVHDLVTGVVVSYGTPVSGAQVNSSLAESKSQIAYGVTAGLCVEVGILPNLFLRGEWEYVAFSNISDVRVQINTVRAGIGLKF